MRITHQKTSLTVKHLKIERNASQNVSQFESITEKEFERTEGHLQSNAISLNGSSATHLRFIITSGYDHFVSVHRLKAVGLPLLRVLLLPELPLQSLHFSLEGFCGDAFDVLPRLALGGGV
ncbi:hypothetical protein FQN60_017837 [Etheostoma spectabile]|uniref:Uncharacterized protein n=1 Tax=Etheostoma spectabile TaxID=54343 RepID=A0A5J5DGD7_9PERO|nr:hypothetical protein FQN60_017837 [Etheostoma spectabile]